MGQTKSKVHSVEQQHNAVDASDSESCMAKMRVELTPSDLRVPLRDCLGAAKATLALRSTFFLGLHLIFLFSAGYNMRPDEALMKTAVSSGADHHRCCIHAWVFTVAGRLLGAAQRA